MSVYDAVRSALPAGASPSGVNNVLGSFGFSGDEVKKPCGVLSGGEKIRLQFARIFVNPPNLLILDEPTTHLDLEGRRSLEGALQQYDGTICFVSHDVEFVRAIATSILWITPDGVRHYPGGYDDFREWQARQEAGKVGGAPPRPAGQGPRPVGDAPQAAQSGAPLSSKDLRRAKAEVRDRYAPRISPLKKAVEETERKIAALEEEEKALSAKMSSGDAGLDFAALGSQLRSVQFQLGRLSLEWEESAGKLEALQREVDAEIGKLTPEAKIP